ncbi:MAG: signal peptidase I [Candidatus Limnocylindrales bacterium]
MMPPNGTASGSRRLPLRALVRVLTVAITVTAVSLVILIRGIPLTGRTTLVVAGPSMSPAIGVGSAIVVEPVDPARLAVGDVVSLRVGPSRAIFTHRIVRLIDRGGVLWLETKGDANAAPDPAIVPASDVLGRVALVIPYSGYLVALAAHPSGMILIIAVGLLLLLSAWILDSKASALSVLQPA